MLNEVRASQLAQTSERVGSLIPAGLLQGVFFALKKTRASGRNVGKVFNPVVKLVLENQPFLNSYVHVYFTSLPTAEPEP